MFPGLPHSLPAPMHSTPATAPSPAWHRDPPHPIGAFPAPPQPSLARASPDHTPMKQALGLGCGWGLYFIGAAGTAVLAAAHACCNQPRVRSPRQELLGGGMGERGQLCPISTARCLKGHRAGGWAGPGTPWPQGLAVPAWLCSAAVRPQAQHREGRAVLPQQQPDLLII